MAEGLIDPMNEDTYDDRVIMSTTKIRTGVPTNAYRRGWEKAFGKKLIIKIRKRAIQWVKKLY